LEVDPVVWTKEWGVNIQPFGSGANAIKYLGAYVCRTAIGDHRILDMDPDAQSVTFTWKDRADGDRQKSSTIAGTEFVARYMRHVLPKGMRSIRYFGFCHPAAKQQRERIAFHTGRPMIVGEDGAVQEQQESTVAIPDCPCCQQPMSWVRALKPNHCLSPFDVLCHRIHGSRSPPMKLCPVRCA
jgi:hypothetical protein